MRGSVVKRGRVRYNPAEKAAIIPRGGDRIRVGRGSGEADLLGRLLAEHSTQQLHQTNLTTTRDHASVHAMSLPEIPAGGSGATNTRSGQSQPSLVARSAASTRFRTWSFRKISCMCDFTVFSLR
jgi:hypothetical protein